MDNTDQQGKSPVTEDAVNTLIAELVVNAPSEEVKKCIKAYEYGKSVKQLSAIFTNFKQEELVSALTYLNVPNRDMYKKPTNIENLICRIQNLLPDTCAMCNEIYCVSNNEAMLLSCVVCGQEVHKKCLSKLINPDGTVDSVLSEMTSERIQGIINPLKIPGFVYVCTHCSKTHLPDPSCGLKKRPATKQKEKEPQKNSVREVEDDNLIIGETQPKHEDNDGNEDNVDTPICKFFLSKKCKHGIKGAHCKFKHPSICKKLLTYGTSEKGCSKWENCSEFHQKMCFSSLKKNECYVANCRYYHVKGTKRIKSEDKNNKLASTDTGEVSKGAPQTANFLEVTQSAPSPPINQGIQSLKAEIMEAMDMRIAILMSCLQTQPNMPGYPLMNPMHPSLQRTNSLCPPGLGHPPGPPPQQRTIPASSRVGAQVNQQMLHNPNNQGLNPVVGQSYYQNQNFPPLNVNN